VFNLNIFSFWMFYHVMGLYKIKDIETLTGIKAHTIRIWEKRYEILTPERTESQIRMYSDEDLVSLLNIAMLNKNGWKISNIAKLSVEEIEKAVESLSKFEDVDDSFEKLILSLVNMDEIVFRNTIKALIKRFGLLEAFNEYVFQFLERIGVMWLVGSINPAQEHFISHLIKQILIAETDQLPYAEAGSKKYLLFLPEHEQHEISLLLYNYKLRYQGNATIYLGQNTPLAGVQAYLENNKVDGVVVSFIGACTIDMVHDIYATIVKYTDAQVYFAGRQFDEFSSKLPNNINSIQQLVD